MKALNVILILVISLNYQSVAQEYSAEVQNEIDSINEIIGTANEDTLVINALFDISDLYYLSRPDTAIILCHKAETLSLKNKYKNGLASSYGWLGYLYQAMGNIQQTLEYKRKFLKLEEEIGDSLEIGRALSGLGNFYQSQSELGVSLQYHRKALFVFQQINDRSGIGLCYNNIGMIYDKQGAISEAIKYYHKSLKICEEIDHDRGIETGLNNIGMLYKNQGELSKALEYYKKSLAIQEEIGDRFGIANMLRNIADIYDDQNDNDKVMEYYQKSIKISEEIGDKLGIAVSLGRIGSLFKDSDNTKAMEYYLKSEKIFEEIGDKEGRAGVLCYISEVWQKQNNLSRAKQYAKQSLALSSEIGYPLMIKNSSQQLYWVYCEEKDWKRALANYELYILMSDSIKNDEAEKAAIKQNMQYEYGRKAAADSIKSTEQKKVLDAQIMAQQAKISQERTFKYSLLGGLGLVILFSIFVINRLSLTRNKKAEIEAKNNVLLERNDEIAYQKEMVEHKNKEVLDSITYAERIQSAILPPMSLVKEYLKQCFVLYKPKDIVAGDFYWIEAIGDDVYFSAADCTGHGVPGAMMSVMCSNALTKCVKELGILTPAEILDETSRIIEGRFERSEQLVLDGMDLALCKINLSAKELMYAGANNPLWIVRGGELMEIRADKQPIGQYDDRHPYTNHSVQLFKGDIIYIFSDGYVDQFGGERGKKFKSKNLKKLLLSFQDDPMDKQQELLNAAFENWKGTIEQIDDVCVFGVQV